MQTGPFGNQLHKKNYVEEDTPIVTVEHLGERIFSKENLPKVCDDDKKRLNSYLLKTGDTVLGRVGSVDRYSYVEKEYEGCLYSGRCLRVRPKINIDPQYLYYYFCLNNTKEYIKNIAVGATMPSINTNLIENMLIEVPNFEIQRKIGQILSLFDKKIEINTSINDNLTYYQANTKYDGDNEFRPLPKAAKNNLPELAQAA